MNDLKSQARDLIPEHINIKISYYLDIVLPYEDGIKFLELLGMGETMKYSQHGNYKVIVPFEGLSDVSLNLITRKEYNDCKAAALLSPEESK